MENQENSELKQAQKIADAYTDKGETKLERLKKLDAKVKRPADILAYSLGIIGSLILGVGMSLALKAIGATLHPAIGIVIGAVGIAVVAANYFIYKAFLKKRKAKYGAQIIELSDEILSGSN